jgi:hypothetical protein
MFSSPGQIDSALRTRLRTEVIFSTKSGFFFRVPTRPQVKSFCQYAGAYALRRVQYEFSLMGGNFKGVEAMYAFYLYSDDPTMFQQELDQFMAAHLHD